MGVAMEQAGWGVGVARGRGMGVAGGRGGAVGVATGRGCGCGQGKRQDGVGLLVWPQGSRAKVSVYPAGELPRCQ